MIMFVIDDDDNVAIGDDDYVVIGDDNVCYR